MSPQYFLFSMISELWINVAALPVLFFPRLERLKYSVGFGSVVISELLVLCSNCLCDSTAGTGVLYGQQHRWTITLGICFQLFLFWGEISLYGMNKLRCCLLWYPCTTTWHPSPSLKLHFFDQFKFVSFQASRRCVLSPHAKPRLYVFNQARVPGE